MSHDAVSRRAVRVHSENGLHLRPLSRIAETARRFAGDIRIVKGERTVDAKNMFDLLTLEAGCGTELVVEAIGEDAEEVVAALGRLFDDHFAEPESPSTATD